MITMATGGKFPSSEAFGSALVESVSSLHSHDSRANTSSG